MTTLLLLLHQVVDALQVAIDPNQLRIVTLTLVVAAAASVRMRGIPKRLVLILAAWPTVTTFYLFPSLHEGRWSLAALRWTLAMLPWALTVAGIANPAMFGQRRRHQILVTLYTLAIVSMVWGKIGGRFDAPNGVLIVGTFMWASTSPRSWLWKAPPLTGLLILSYISGYRSSVIVWVLSAALTTARRLGWASAARVTAALALVIAVGLWSGIMTTEPVLSPEDRFGLLLTPEQDRSIGVRLAEIADAQREIGSWPAYQWLLGAGHGGTYEAQLLMSRNNVFEDGAVHHIHFGPLFMLFHYGLIGMGLLAGLVASVVRQVACLDRLSATEAFFAVSTASFFVKLLTHDIMLDPWFSWSLAGYLLSRYWPAQLDAPPTSWPAPASERRGQRVTTASTRDAVGWL